jgi:hypothetical protein
MEWVIQFHRFVLCRTLHNPHGEARDHITTLIRGNRFSSTGAVKQESGRWI